MAVPGKRIHETATRWAILATIALGASIAVLTLMPPSQVDMPSGSDKPAHFIAFFMLALPLAIVRTRWSGVLFVLFTTFGAAIEILQPYVGRSREVADLAADVAGIICGTILGVIVGHLFPALRAPDTGRQQPPMPQ